MNEKERAFYAIRLSGSPAEGAMYPISINEDTPEEDRESASEYKWQQEIEHFAAFGKVGIWMDKGGSRIWVGIHALQSSFGRLVAIS